MTWLRRSGLFLAIAQFALPTPLPCAAAFNDLLMRVPAGANALVLVDVSTTLATSVAKENGWGQKLKLAYVDRPIFLPPEATKLVMAASLRSSDDFSRLWELAVMELSEPMSMRAIARSEGGYVDQINGVVSAWTPSNAYFVSFDENALGVMFPAERQFVSRWVDFAQRNNTNLLSDYLLKATQLSNAKIPILLAMDLRDVVRPHDLEEKLQDFPLIKKSGISITDASEILASLQGVTLRIAVGKDVQGQLRIDFTESVTPIESIAKELVTKVLDDVGASIDDLADWELKIEERAITMRGVLSKDGQRRVFSVIEIPSTKFSTLSDAESVTSTNAADSKIREASLTYFRAVEVLFKDLKRDMHGNKAVAAVMERYARKIDRMPILHVDDELLDYGSQVAETLRAVALSKRGGGIQAGTQTAGMGQGRQTNTSYREYGLTLAGDQLYAAKESAAERSSIRANAMAGYRNARVAGAKQIADSTADIRRQMTKKYDVEF